ncbi:unnamed protein product, partial [Coregonus sp. 'balchen']
MAGIKPHRLGYIILLVANTTTDDQQEKTREANHKREKKRPTDTFSEMSEDWGSAAFAARQHNQETTKSSSFTFTNSNKTK